MEILQKDTSFYAVTISILNFNLESPAIQDENTVSRPVAARVWGNLTEKTH